MNIEDVTLYFREGGSDKALLTRCPQSRKKSLTPLVGRLPKKHALRLGEFV
jgi:hypothetical protein